MYIYSNTLFHDHWFNVNNILFSYLEETRHFESTMRDRSKDIKIKTVLTVTVNHEVTTQVLIGCFHSQTLFQLYTICRHRSVLYVTV